MFERSVCPSLGGAVSRVLDAAVEGATLSPQVRVGVTLASMELQTGVCGVLDATDGA